MKIKHPPPKLAATQPVTVYVSSKGPFVSALKRIQRNVERLDRNKLGRYLTVFGLGLAIHKTLALAMELQVQGYVVEIRTKTLTTHDEEVDENQAETTMSSRSVSAVELRVWPNKNR